MNITVIGTGYVGLVTGACLADLGNHVFCLDVDLAKIQLLNGGGVPIYEPGLKELIDRNVEAGRLTFSTDVAASVAHGSVQFIAVGTPSDEDGSADLQYVLAAARNIGRLMGGFKVVVNKSTVPVGTADQVTDTIHAELATRYPVPLSTASRPSPQVQEGSYEGQGAPTLPPLPYAEERRGESLPASNLGPESVTPTFAVISNPEFLKEGEAIEDFTRPDRIVLGVGSDPLGQQALTTMRQLYAPFNRNHERTRVMDVKSAEFTKYAANAMLATRISFMNDLVSLADSVGADIEMVRQGIGSDPRIGYSFLYAGTGYGGSCFPKDVKALIKTAQSHGQTLRVLQAVEDVNNDQKMVLVNKIFAKYGTNLAGKTFALWGLAFKPNTNDMRDAPSRVVIGALLRAGARIVAHDPVATKEAQHALALDLADAPELLNQISFVAKPMNAVQGADALVIVTEWKAYRSPNWKAIKEAMRAAIVFDGRNLYEPLIVQTNGVDYSAVGRHS